MVWVVKATPLPLSPNKWPVTHCIGGWVGHSASMSRYKNLTPNGIRSPDQPDHRESLYWLHYPDPHPELTIEVLKTSHWTLTQLISYLFTQLITHLITCLLTHLFIYFLHSLLTHSNFHLLTHWFTYLLTHLLIHLLTITYLLTYLLTHLIIYLLPYLLTHLLLYLPNHFLTFSLT
jgi:hypothetical protein